MNITVVGTGYVGLVSGACFAELGHQVVCVDANAAKVAQLQQGHVPIYEPGLTELVRKNLAAGRLSFVNTLAAQLHVPELLIVAVGTPSTDTGAADLRYIIAVAHDIGRYLTHDCIVVNKSTVPVGVSIKIKEIIQAELEMRQVKIAFDVVSNPEFLREGVAIDDFMCPDRIIIGYSNESSKQFMLSLYLPLVAQPDKIYCMSLVDAEMTKYVANAMLATRISFMNEIAILCEHIGADVEQVRVGVGADHRIGAEFLHAGCGYGGSCFPKDLNALLSMAARYNFTPQVLQAVVQRNDAQREVIFNRIMQIFAGNLAGKLFTIWGLAFKPDTDDIREAPSLVLIEKLLQAGARVNVCDPVAMPAGQTWFGEAHLKQLSFITDQYAALAGAEAMILLTPWQQFLSPDFARMHQLMSVPLILDGRNQYAIAEVMNAGFAYYSIGRGYHNEPALNTVEVAV